MTIEDLLASYPRGRPPLTSAHQQIYDQEYKLNRVGGTLFSGLSQKAERWMHRQVAGSAAPGDILEIGAGTLNHLPYEITQELRLYDIVEPYEALYRDSPYRGRIRNFHRCITQIRSSELYDRIISIAVLEHLTDLPFVIAYTAMHLKENGVFQHGIPSEGGVAWSLGWRLTTGLSFRLRTGLSYGILMRHEHVNTASEILAMVRYFFESVLVRRFPLPGHHLSLYTYIHAKIPNKERCSAFLRKRNMNAASTPEERLPEVAGSSSN